MKLQEQKLLEQTIGEFEALEAMSGLRITVKQLRSLEAK